MAPSFTYPFTIGVIILFGVLIYKAVKWYAGFTKYDKIRIRKGFFTRKTLKSIKESFNDGLLHVSIFRRNPMLGYMHMSLAFGWFLLIIVGHLESVITMGTFRFPFYYAVFLRYFNPLSVHPFSSEIFKHVMDFLLLFVLSGVSLAYFKRINKRLFGMKRTTKLKVPDKMALTSLWFIFPLRLFAESISAGIKHNGGFLTQPLGDFLVSILNVYTWEYPVWFAYSLSLGVFFVFLTSSRYAHIPTEILYIFLRNYGIKLKKKYNTYTNVQVYSCSRCGMCLDICQLNDANIHTQSVYLIKRIRNHNLTDDVLFNCLLCGKCQQACPVHIDIDDLRITQRIESTRQYNSSYDYLQEMEAISSKVVYFAGCMSHLTPGIVQAMKKIFAHSGTSYWFMDEDKAPCCGRPLMQAGQYDAAMKLIETNRKAIYDSGATQLITSCPICYKVFKEDYHLKNIQVLHHTQFILKLIEKGKIPAMPTGNSFVYHDPCDLGRGSNIYEQPREILRKYGTLIPIRKEKENALCCGGSLANIKIDMTERDAIKKHALDMYFGYKPDMLVTACPLCKKTFTRNNIYPIFDIAEIVAATITQSACRKVCEVAEVENML